MGPPAPSISKMPREVVKAEIPMIKLRLNVHFSRLLATREELGLIEAVAQMFIPIKPIVIQML